MTKIDHEKLNHLGKAHKDEPSVSICAAPELKTFKGQPKNMPKINHKRMGNLLTTCGKCGVKLTAKKIPRHNFLVHESMMCPFCNEEVVGFKKLGRHIKKVHGHNKYGEFRKSSNKALKQGATHGTAKKQAPP